MTRHLTSSSVARRLLFGTALLLIANQVARAETVELMCPAPSGNVPDGMYHVAIDLGDSTVTVWQTGVIWPNPNKSTYQAQVNNQQVAWDDGVSAKWSLDRTTGVLLQFWRGIYGDTGTNRYNCAKSSRVF